LNCENYAKNTTSYNQSVCWPIILFRPSIRPFNGRNLSFHQWDNQSVYDSFIRFDGKFVLVQFRELRMGVRAPAAETVGRRIMLICYYVGDNGAVREQRHIIIVDTQVILETTLRLVDASSGALVLECGQTDNLSFLVNGHAAAAPLWLCDTIEDIPEWPGPPYCSALPLPVFGENFVSSPFPPGCSVPYCAHHIFRPLTIQQTHKNSCEPTQRLSAIAGASDENSFALICKISTPSPIIYHNFSEKRICHIPVQIAITNDDVRNRRNCSVTVHFQDSFFVRKQPQPELGSPGGSGIVPPPAVSAFSTPHLHSPSPVVQPVVVADRTRMRSTIAFGSTRIFDIHLSVYCSSVYDIARFRVIGQFDDDDEAAAVSIRVPCAYVTVIDQRVP
uniref:Arrestin_C domain-containing protein n=1 Tax=Gongylonema pulchrum TaxID=637853 RepID=A0A183EIT0_9BILA